jgi:probable blue pigment (indigoidine) exporter
MLAFFSRHRHSLSLVGAAACWGVATVVSKRALDEIPPLTLLPVQLAVSVLVLGTLVRSQRLRINWSADMRRLAALGVLNPGVSYALGLIGLSFITASLAVLLWAVEPLIILVLAWWLLGDRVTMPVATASVIAWGGVVLVVFESGSRGQATGIAFTLAGVVGCAVYTVAVRKLMGSDSTLTVILVQQTCALVFSLLALALADLFNFAVALEEVSAGAWASAALSGVLYYALAYWFYLTGLRRIPAGVAGSFINLIPIFGIATGHLFLGERLTSRQWIGAVVIVVSVGAILASDRRRLEAVGEPVVADRSP